MIQPAHASVPRTQQVHDVADSGSGLHGVIVLHSTRLGPAAGGCRFWQYSDHAALTADAVRLAEGMSYKNALADLPLGGGKAVLQRPAGDFDRVRLFEAFGHAVEGLNGTYVTAEDVGTTTADMVAVANATKHVAGLAPATGWAGGSPSPWTARGVFLAMEVMVQRQLGRSLEGVAVAVQGLGNVGFLLCTLLHNVGVRLIVADTRKEIVDQAVRNFGAQAVAPDAIVSFPADVFAPCALGAVLNGDSIAMLAANVVCGAANNQLATSEDGARLADKGVLYAPDYLVNAGGIINAAGEHLGWTSEEVALRVDKIPVRLNELLDLATKAGIPTNIAADQMAREKIDSGPRKARLSTSAA